MVECYYFRLIGVQRDLRRWVVTNEDMELPGFDIVTIWQHPRERRNANWRQVVAHLNAGKKEYHGSFISPRFYTEIAQAALPSTSMLVVEISPAVQFVRWKDLEDRLEAALARHNIPNGWS